MTIHRTWQEQDALKWLGREAPRYTSYPSAHHFQAVGPADYAGWLQAQSPGQSVGLYVHIPYCSELCWFCGCNTQITKRYDAIEAYVDVLIREIALVSRVIGRRPAVHSLHFGGGSPGLLSEASLDQLMARIRDAFDILPTAEISIELDPRKVTPALAKAYALHGFNRVSLGVQDIDPDVQKAINRHQPLAVVVAAADALREAGIRSLGIDIIYGLPKQTSEGLRHSLAQLAAIAPERISAFSYAHVPWARKNQRLIDATTLPDMPAKLEQFMAISDSLCESGYVPVGIDHFARADDGLAIAKAEGRLRRNFMGYTDQPNDVLIGLGASSISETNFGLAQNAPQVATYRRLVEDGILPTVRGWRFQGDDKVRGEVITELMCRFEADLGLIAARYDLAQDYFDEEMALLREFVDAGIVSVQGRTVRFVSPLSMLVRSVACVFDRYAQAASQGSYSKVA